MITAGREWIMEGLPAGDVRALRSPEEALALIDRVGFVPLFASDVRGCSLEENTASSAWWNEFDPDGDPWNWRIQIAASGRCAYGKLFGGRAGFVSREWFPVLAAYRRDGYDFDSLYEDGKASRRSKLIMDTLEKYGPLTSFELKPLAGFGKGGEKGFEGAVTRLQMQTYLTMQDFRRKRNKRGEEYGWMTGVLAPAETLFGYDHGPSAYHLSHEQAMDKMAAHLHALWPDATDAQIEMLLKG